MYLYTNCTLYNTHTSIINLVNIFSLIYSAYNCKNNLYLAENAESICSEILQQVALKCVVLNIDK